MSHLFIFNLFSDTELFTFQPTSFKFWNWTEQNTATHSQTIFISWQPKNTTFCFYQVGPFQFQYLIIATHKQKWYPVIMSHRNTKHRGEQNRSNQQKTLTLSTGAREILFSKQTFCFCHESWCQRCLFLWCSTVYVTKKDLVIRDKTITYRV